MTPHSESESEGMPIPYSRMTEEDAQIAFSTRKEQIKAMLKTRSAVQTPDSINSKYVSSTTKSKKNTQQIKPFPIRFSADPEKISKHSIDLPLESQQQLKERLKSFKPENEPQIQPKKYDVSEPLYKRTVEWKQNLIKQKEVQMLCKNEQILNECTFEPSIDKSEIRNSSVGIYTRNVEWKNSMIKRNELIKDQKQIKEFEECSFQPKIISNNANFSVDFQQRNEIWQERLYKKMKRIEEESTKDHVFYPKIIKTKVNSKTDKEFDNRFSKFLSKIDEISEKIDNSLANSVL